MTIETRKFKLGKWGLAENPIGRHVAMTWQGRELLGEVKRIHRNETRGCTLLEVIHFCGDRWPVDPAVTAVNVLD